MKHIINKQYDGCVLIAFAITALFFVCLYAASLDPQSIQY
jgi:hypothetical protein